MDKLDLDAMEARAKAASGEPWVIARGQDPVIFIDNNDFVLAALYEHMGVEEQNANAEFIINSRKDIPALIGRVRKLEKGIKEAIIRGQNIPEGKRDEDSASFYDNAINDLVGMMEDAINETD